MSFQKSKSDSYCIGGKRYSGTIIIKGDLTSNGRKMLIGSCAICNGKKSMILTDNTIRAEGLGDFFKNIGKKGLNVSKKWQKMYSKILAELLISQQIFLQQQQVEIQRI